MNAEVSNHSDENGMNFDYNFNVDADDFNVLMNGKVTGQPTDFNFNMETTYTKTEVFFLIPYMGLDARKPVFRNLWTTKAQTSLHICAVWSAPLLFTDLKVLYLNLLQGKFHYSS